MKSECQTSSVVSSVFFEQQWIVISLPFFVLFVVFLSSYQPCLIARIEERTKHQDILESGLCDDVIVGLVHRGGDPDRSKILSAIHYEELHYKGTVSGCRKAVNYVAENVFLGALGDVTNPYVSTMRTLLTADDWRIQAILAFLSISLPVVTVIFFIGGACYVLVSYNTSKAETERFHALLPSGDQGSNIRRMHSPLTGEMRNIAIVQKK